VLIARSRTKCAVPERWIFIRAHPGGALATLDDLEIAIFAFIGAYAHVQGNAVVGGENLTHAGAGSDMQTRCSISEANLRGPGISGLGEERSSRCGR
jgi:hypothetical protein